MAFPIKLGQIWADSRQDTARYFKILRKGKYWWITITVNKIGDDFCDPGYPLNSITFKEFNAAFPALVMVKEAWESEEFLEAVAKARNRHKFKPSHFSGYRD